MKPYACTHVAHKKQTAAVSLPARNYVIAVEHKLQAPLKMLNYHVYCQTRKKVLVPWTIEAINPPNLTFRQFLSNKVDFEETELDQTFVGKSKDKLDLVSADLVAADVIQTFGPYVKYLVNSNPTVRPSGAQGRPMFLAKWQFVY